MSLSHRNQPYDPTNTEVTQKSFIATDGLFEHSNVIDRDVVIAAGNNALSAGPITIADNRTITLSDNSTWALIG